MAIQVRQKGMFSEETTYILYVPKGCGIEFDDFIEILEIWV